MQQMQDNKIKVSQEPNLEQKLKNKPALKRNSSQFKPSAKKKNVVTIMDQIDEDANERTICLQNCVGVLRNMVEKTAFNVIKVLFICISCIVLINTHPQVDRGSSAASPYLIIDKICIGFFILELIIILSVYGLFLAPSSYLRRSWLNWINIVIIVIEVLSFTELNEEPVFLKIERFKVLRILYLV